MDNAQKTENDIKKEYLRSYLDHVRRVNRINAEIAELRLMKLHPSMKSEDGMPHGSGSQSDLSGYVAKIDEMIDELLSERFKRIKTYHDIVKRINDLRSRNESDVLFYRYIKGMDWYEVAEEMHLSERQTHRIHGKALLHFEIPKKIKDVSECQLKV